MKYLILNYRLLIFIYYVPFNIYIYIYIYIYYILYIYIYIIIKLGDFIAPNLILINITVKS